MLLDFIFFNHVVILQILLKMEELHLGQPLLSNLQKLIMQLILANMVYLVYKGKLLIS